MGQHGQMPAVQGHYGIRPKIGGHSVLVIFRKVIPGGLDVKPVCSGQGEFDLGRI